jgi:hypothetical protein
MIFLSLPLPSITFAQDSKLSKRTVVGKVLDRGVHVFTQKCKWGSKIHKKSEMIFLVHLKGIMVHKMIDLLNYCGLTNPIACTFCRTKGTYRTKQNSTERSETRGMEDAQRTYNYEDEVRGLGVSMGNAGTKSNGHGEGKEESMNLVETIKSLQRDVQSYKVDNEKLMKAKEQQDGFNIKLL